MESNNTYYNQLAGQAVSDSAAFEELYNYFFPRVYNFLFARLKNSAAADDVVSTTFMKAYSHLGEYLPERAAFSTWLFRIAQNAVTDYFRQQQRSCEDEWADFFNPPSPEQEQPEAKILINENNQELLLAVDKLKPREKQLIELKYWADLSNKEIAAVMGISAGTVGVYLFRATAALKKLLEEK